MRIADRLTSKLSVVRGVASDPERKPVGRIVRDLVRTRARGEPLGFYVERLAFRDGAGDADDYLTRRDLYKLWGVKRRGEGWTRNYDDKLLFDQLMRPSGLRLPELLGYTRMGSLVSASGEAEPLRDRETVSERRSDLLAASPGGALFAKPIIAMRGWGRSSSPRKP